MSSHSSSPNESDRKSTKTLLKQLAKHFQALSYRQLQHETLLKERDAHFAKMEEELQLVKEKGEYITKSTRSSKASSSRLSDSYDEKNLRMHEYYQPQSKRVRREEKENSERAYPCEDELMMIRRTLNNQSSVNQETQRENIFHTRCKVLENLCSLIMDSGSCYNCCSARVVEKLNLQLIPDPKPYKLQWKNEDGELTVDKQVKVKFSMGNYRDKVLCDVVPMEACHIFLGRP